MVCPLEHPKKATEGPEQLCWSFIVFDFKIWAERSFTKTKRALSPGRVMFKANFVRPTWNLSPRQSVMNDTDTTDDWELDEEQLHWFRSYHISRILHRTQRPTQENNNFRMTVLLLQRRQTSSARHVELDVKRSIGPLTEESSFDQTHPFDDLAAT